MWYSYDVFHYKFRAEFVMLVSLKVPSGHCSSNTFHLSITFHSLSLSLCLSLDSIANFFSFSVDSRELLRKEEEEEEKGWMEGRVATRDVLIGPFGTSMGWQPLLVSSGLKKKVDS